MQHLFSTVAANRTVKLSNDVSIDAKPLLSADVFGERPSSVLINAGRHKAKTTKLAQSLVKMATAAVPDAVVVVATSGQRSGSWKTFANTDESKRNPVTVHAMSDVLESNLLWLGDLLHFQEVGRLLGVQRKIILVVDGCSMMDDVLDPCQMAANNIWCIYTCAHLRLRYYSKYSFIVSAEVPSAACVRQWSTDTRLSIADTYSLLKELLEEPNQTVWRPSPGASPSYQFLTLTA